jgi:nickel-type superoxide dismutase maturation protease
LVAGTLAGLAGSLLALRRLDAVAVSGHSMAPGLLPGDRLVVESLTYAIRAPRPGEVVLARDPRRPSRELVKRIAAVHDGRVDLRGDAPAASTDSRAFGHVKLGAVRWRAGFRYWPPGRIGAIPAALVVPEAVGGEPACTAFEDLVLGAG